MRLKFPLSPYRMLLTHNIAWRKLRSLLLNIAKRRKAWETQNCPNSSFSDNFCHWLSEKSVKCAVQYFKVVHFDSNWRHAFTHYVTIISVLINIGSQTRSLITWASQTKIFRSKFCTFFSLIEIWGRLTLFPVTDLLSIFDYILDKWVNCWNF